jgi:hypothetical protein
MPVRGVACALAIVALVAGGACAGDDGGSNGACGPAQREALDPAHLVHVLPSAEDVTYLSDPPTSGPHQPGPEVVGVVTDPIPKPVQVGILEGGGVLIQYDPDALEADEVATLEGLADEATVVAPAPDLPEAVIATAWVFSQRCQDVDVDALRSFVDERAGHGPEG